MAKFLFTETFSFYMKEYLSCLARTRCYQIFVRKSVLKDFRKY